MQFKGKFTLDSCGRQSVRSGHSGYRQPLTRTRAHMCRNTCTHIAQVGSLGAAMTAMFNLQQTNTGAAAARPWPRSRQTFPQANAMTDAERLEFAAMPPPPAHKGSRSPTAGHDPAGAWAAESQMVDYGDNS